MLPRFHTGYAGGSILNGYRIALAAIPRAAVIHATFDGSDPRQGAVVSTGEFDAPNGASQLRVIAVVAGAFGQEEAAPLGGGFEEGSVGSAGASKPKVDLKPDTPARLVSRFEPKDTAAAFSALDRLAKISEARVLGGSVELNGQRSEGDFLSLRLGRDVGVPATELDRSVKELARLLDALQPTVKLTFYQIAFPSGRDLMSFCDASGEDFDRVDWKQD
jgi:hypothetical protein